VLDGGWSGDQYCRSWDDATRAHSSVTFASAAAKDASGQDLRSTMRKTPAKAQ